MPIYQSLDLNYDFAIFLSKGTHIASEDHGSRMRIRESSGFCGFYVNYTPVRRIYHINVINHTRRVDFQKYTTLL